jgi:hypothetical protein
MNRVHILILNQVVEVAPPRLLRRMCPAYVNGNDCWLGGNVIVDQGVAIGNGVTVGVGCVVTMLEY